MDRKRKKRPFQLMSNYQMDSIHSGARAKLWSRIQPHSFLACSLLEFTTAIRAAYYHNNKISIYWIFLKNDVGFGDFIHSYRFSGALPAAPGIVNLAVSPVDVLLDGLGRRRHCRTSIDVLSRRRWRSRWWKDGRSDRFERWLDWTGQRRSGSHSVFSDFFLQGHQHRPVNRSQSDVIARIPTENTKSEIQIS